MTFIKNLRKDRLIALMDEQKNKTEKIITESSLAIENSHKAEKAFSKSHTDFEAEKVNLKTVVARVDTQTKAAIATIEAKLPIADAEIEKIKVKAISDVNEFIENELKTKGNASLLQITSSEAAVVKSKNNIDKTETDILAKRTHCETLEAGIKSTSNEVAKYKNNILGVASEIIGDENGNHINGSAMKARLVALEAEINKTQEAANSLNSQSESILEKVTDSGLHGSYERSADRYRKSTWIILIAQCVILLVMAGLAYKAINIIKLEEVLKNILPTIPLGVLVFFLQRAYTVEKKLTEEYQHKSTLTKTLAGYRSLYDLKHSDPEYMALFNHVKDGITRNPSEEINPLLHKRLLIDKVVDTIDNVVESASQTVVSSVKVAESAMDIVKVPKNEIISQ